MQAKVVSHQDLLRTRLDLLAAGKGFTHQRDALTKLRRAMSWECVEKAYRFEEPEGALSLSDLMAWGSPP
jgi:predicted dithiol-disulfide oxidoreductase (DUF899 family)